MCASHFILSAVAAKAQQFYTLSARLQADSKRAIMKIEVFAAAAMITVSALGSANAADLPLHAPAYAPPPPAPIYNWTGCYVGAGGGYAFWQQDSFVVSPGGAPLTASQSNGGKGWFGQGQVGCDYQFTAPYFGLQTVIGAFSDIEGGSINGSSSFPGFTGSERESSTWAVGGRAGVLVTPRFLTYFDGGFTQARFDGVNYNFAFAGGGPSGVSLAAQTYNGWFIGSGFEYAFTWLPINGLFLKTEFRYSQYGGNGVNVPLSGVPLPGVFSLNSQKATEFVSTELVYRFNWFGR
jgi:outer membrane immunogenic protein